MIMSLNHNAPRSFATLILIVLIAKSLITFSHLNLLFKKPFVQSHGLRIARDEEETSLEAP